MAGTDWVKAPTKQSLLAMLKKAKEITPRLLSQMFDGVVFKNELKGYTAGGAVDHGSLTGLTDDDHSQYLLASSAGSRALFTSRWTDLTDAGATTLHKHDHGGMDGLGDDDHTQYLLAAGDTVTGLLNFSGAGDIAASVYDSVCLSTYVDVKARNTTYDLHGAWDVLATGQPLDAVPTNIVVTVGTGKIVVVINAGSDLSGDITVTGTSVNRNTGAETAADTDTLTVDALTTDGSDTDADGNVRHSFTGAYITSKWFKGSVTLSTTNLTLTDVDVYQVAFEQFNDSPVINLKSFDMTALATNASAWMYAYLYTLVVSGDKCNITRESSLDLPTAEVSANKYYRLRRGNLTTVLNGTSDGIWVEMFPGPLASVYWEDINVKVWAKVKSDVFGESS
jgi:hypothetical protein